MLNSKSAPPRNQLNTLMLLAITTLSASNMLVGILTQNTFLIIASALLAAAFAIIYLLRTRLFAGKSQPAVSSTELTKGYGPKLPIWVFPAILFIALPGLLLLMQAILPKG